MPEPLLLAEVRPGSVGALIVASLAVMGSPGPATISIAAVGSAYGVRRSLKYLIGIILGTTLVLIAVATGLTATLLAVPALRPVLVVISAAYILWLAYHIATAPPFAQQRETSDAPSLTGGTLLAVANPKAWVAIAAVFASARLAETATLDAAAKTVVLGLMIVVIMIAWLLAGAALAPMLRDPRRSRVINIALAAALVVTTALAVLH
jgi:threonine/homoserine/homoserine lactone efflux protein